VQAIFEGYKGSIVEGFVIVRGLEEEEEESRRVRSLLAVSANSDAVFCWF
jgi:hypothetical protein